MPELTRQQQIQKALRILLPRTASAEDRELCKREIVGVLDVIKRQLNRPLFGRMEKALQNVGSAQDRAHRNRSRRPLGPARRASPTGALCRAVSSATRAYRSYLPPTLRGQFCVVPVRYNGAVRLRGPKVVPCSSWPLSSTATSAATCMARYASKMTMIASRYSWLPRVIGIDNLTFSDGVVSEDEARQFMAVLPSLSRKRES